MFLVSCGALESRLDATAYKPVFNFNSVKFDVQKLSNIAFINPKTVFDKLDTESEISFVPMEVIDEKNGMISNFQTKKVKDTKGFTRFQENDLIWAKITPCMQNGKSAVVRNTLQGYACGSTEFFIIRPKSEKLLIDYVHILLRDDRILENAQNFFGGSAGQQRVSIDYLKNLKIPIPPLSTQTQIVQLFAQAYESKKAKETEAKRLLAGIDAYLLEKLGIETSQTLQGFENLVRSKPSFFVKFSQVQGKRFDPFYHKTEFAENIEVIKSGKYEVKSLKQIAQRLIKGKLPKDQEKEGICKVVQINSIRENGNIDIDDLLTAKEIFMPEQKMQKNDVLVVITGATIGKIAIWEQDSEGYFLGGDIVKFQCLENVNPYYVFAWLRFKNSQIEIKRNVTGATNGHLSPSDVGNILIPLPPLSLQTEIAEHIQGVRAEAKRLENEAKDEVMKAKKEVERLILN